MCALACEGAYKKNLLHDGVARDRGRQHDPTKMICNGLSVLGTTSTRWTRDSTSSRSNCGMSQMIRSGRRNTGLNACPRALRCCMMFSCFYAGQSCKLDGIPGAAFNYQQTVWMWSALLCLGTAVCLLHLLMKLISKSPWLKVVRRRVCFHTLLAVLGSGLACLHVAYREPGLVGGLGFSLCAAWASGCTACCACRCMCYSVDQFKHRCVRVGRRLSCQRVGVCLHALFSLGVSLLVFLHASPGLHGAWWAGRLVWAVFASGEVASCLYQLRLFAHANTRFAKPKGRIRRKRKRLMSLRRWGRRVSALRPCVFPARWVGGSRRRLARRRKLVAPVWWLPKPDAASSPGKLSPYSGPRRSTVRFWKGGTGGKGGAAATARQRKEKALLEGLRSLLLSVDEGGGSDTEGSGCEEATGLRPLLKRKPKPAKSVARKEEDEGSSLLDRLKAIVSQAEKHGSKNLLSSLRNLVEQSSRVPNTGDSSPARRVQIVTADKAWSSVGNQARTPTAPPAKAPPKACPWGRPPLAPKTAPKPRREVN